MGSSLESSRWEAPRGGVPSVYLDLLVPEGFACLALGSFGTKDTQSTLVEVPLERVERGLRWLIAHSQVATHDGRVALIGVGRRAAKLALLVAATFPDRRSSRRLHTE